MNNSGYQPTEDVKTPPPTGIKINRRNKLYENTSAEKAIYDAMQEVEKVGADVRLTEAVMLLAKAKDLVADYVDEKINNETQNPQ